VSTWLGIEAATPTGSVAVSRHGTLLAEVTLGLTTRHSELLLPAIDFVLHAAGVERRLLDGIVVGEGPGSFTGVRIAAATARGLATALSIPLFAVSSLAATAASVPQPDRAVCALFDARRGEVYAACYRFAADGMETLLPPVAATVAEVVARTAPFTPLFVGEGATRYAAQLPSPPAPGGLAMPRAAALLWVHGLDPERGRIEQAAGWEPTYLRTSGAERGLSV
jgi:tRNA threonylcarbamoyladenosine biosynthesis protein TsaB